MTAKDKEEIKRLIELKKWILWYRTLSEEEKQKIIRERWTKTIDKI